MAAIAIFDGEKLQARREFCGLSREALAVQIQRSFSLIVKCEAGTARPSLRTLGRLMAALDCSADDLMSSGAAL